MTGSTAFEDEQLDADLAGILGSWHDAHAARRVDQSNMAIVAPTLELNTSAASIRTRSDIDPITAQKHEPSETKSGQVNTRVASKFWVAAVVLSGCLVVGLTAMTNQLKPLFQQRTKSHIITVVPLTDSKVKPSYSMVPAIGVTKKVNVVEAEKQSVFILTPTRMKQKLKSTRSEPRPVHYQAKLKSVVKTPVYNPTKMGRRKEYRLLASSAKRPAAAAPKPSLSLTYPVVIRSNADLHKLGTKIDTKQSRRDSVDAIRMLRKQ